MHKHHTSSSIKKLKAPKLIVFFRKTYKRPIMLVVWKLVSCSPRHIGITLYKHNTPSTIKKVRDPKVFAFITGVFRLKQRSFTKLPNNRKSHLLGSLSCYGDIYKYYGVQTS